MTDEEMAVDQEAESGSNEQEELSEDQQFMEELKEAVTVKREDLGGLRTKLTVTVPRETIEGRMSKEFAELKREAAIPGFRKGHAPIKLVEKRFAMDVGQQLKSRLLGSGYLAAVEKEAIKPLGDPLIWVRLKEERIGEDGRPRNVEVDKLLPLDRALEHVDLSKSGPLTFSCEMEVKPEFELPELTSIPVTRPKLSISESDVDSAINRLRQREGTFQPVEQGGVDINDLLYVDMKFSINGEILAAEQNLDIAARPMRLKGVSLPDLGDALKGKKVGDEVVLEATVPEDYENADFRGKKARFELAIREIKRLVIPPIDADFLANTGFETVEDFRAEIRSQLESRLDRTIKDRMLEQIADFLVENTRLEIPAGLSQRQTDRSVARRMIDLLQRGIPETEVERAMDEMRVKAHDQTVRDLKLFFILEKISSEREVEVTEEDLNTAISDIARQSGKRFDRVRDELSKSDGLSMLYLRIRDEKVLEQLLQEAQVSEGRIEESVEGAQPDKDKPKTPKKKPAVKSSSKVESSKAAEKPQARKPAGKKPAARPEKNAGKPAARKKKAT